jgi:hypothetical protein
MGYYPTAENAVRMLWPKLEGNWIFLCFCACLLASNPSLSRLASDGRQKNLENELRPAQDKDVFNAQSETKGFRLGGEECPARGQTTPKASLRMSFLHPRRAPYPNSFGRRLFHIPRLLKFLGGCFGFAALSAIVHAGTLTLAWNGSPSPIVAGYAVFYGEASRTYTSSLNVGSNLTAALTGLTPGLTYYFGVIAYDANGDQSAFSNEITNRLPIIPSIIVQPLTPTAFAGLPVTLTVGVAGDPPLSFQWFDGLVPVPGATASSLSWPQIASSNAGNYSVMVSNPWGSTTSAVATVTVIAVGPPLILTQPQSQTVIATAAASFSSTTLGIAPLSFQWYDGTTPLAGATNTLLALAHVADSNAGNYHFTVVNAAGAATSSVVTLTVIDHPSILTQPQSQTVISTTAASFSSTITGTAPLSFQWYDGTMVIAGAPNSVLAWTRVADSNAGNYYFTVANAAGVVTSSLATLTVIDLPSILTQPQSHSVIVATPTSFSSATAGTAPLSFQWYDGATAIAGATSSVLAWASVADSNAGSYHFTVANAAGSVMSSVATLTVIDHPAILTQPQSQTVIATTPASFSSVSTGTAPLSIQWYDGTTAIMGATSSTLAWPGATSSNAGSYHFTVANAAGAVTSSVATLTVLPTNTIATVAGAYNGLFFPTNANGTPNITETSAGFLGNCIVASNGAYSAKIYLGGLSCSLAGVFNISGNASATIPLAGFGLTNLTAVMHLDLINGTRQMTGRISSTTVSNVWTAPLLADLAPNVTTGQLAVVNLLISPGSSSNAPTNDGVASGVIVNGVLSLAGVLGDNTAVSQTVPISQNGNAPIYVNLYNNNGLLEGWINLAGSNVTGNLTWVCPGTGLSLAGGFNTVVQVTGTASSQ